MIRIIGYILILSFFISCTSKKDCPPYPKQNLSWIPYQLDKKIQFTDGADTTAFIFDVAFVPEAYSTHDDCYVETTFETEINSDLKLQIEIHSYYVEKSTSYDYWFFNAKDPVDPNLPRREYLDEFGFGKINGTINKNIIDEIELDGKIFNDVIKLELDTIDKNLNGWKKPRIWRIMIAISIGLIQFDECSPQKTWRITD